MTKDLKTATRLFLLMLLITGVIYPLLITGFGQVLFKPQANGGIISNNGKIIGATLIAQQFTRPEYFHPRPSKAGSGYDAMNSGASNLSTTNASLQADIAARFKLLSEENPEIPVPSDLLTASASGLDPHISPASAQFQAARIAKARKKPIEDIKKLIESNIEGRFLNLFGEKRVNILLLNLQLDRN